jgi:hypothetical protein
MAADRRQDRHPARRNHTHRLAYYRTCGVEPVSCPCLTGGRPRVYCSDACRARAYRIRKRLVRANRLS